MKVVHAAPYASDEFLFAKVKKDDYHAYTQLHNRYRKLLLHFASRYTRDDFYSEEIVQEFFLQLWIKRQVLVIDCSLPSYFFRAVRNRIFNHFRNHAAYKKRLLLTDRPEAVAADEIFKGLDRRDRERKINRLIDTLPREYKEVYALRVEHHLSNRKTASVLNRSVHTVDKQIRKIVYFLGENLSEN